MPMLGISPFALANKQTEMAAVPGSSPAGRAMPILRPMVSTARHLQTVAALECTSHLQALAPSVPACLLSLICHFHSAVVESVRCW